MFPEGRSLAEKYEVVLKGVMHALAWGQEQTEACNTSTLLLGLWARKQKDFYVWEQPSRHPSEPIFLKVLCSLLLVYLEQTGEDVTSHQIFSVRSGVGRS